MRKNNAKTPDKRQKTAVLKKIRWGLIAGIAVACFIAFNFIGQFIRYDNLNTDLANYKNQLAQTENRYQDLLKQKELLNDDSYMEILARDIGLIKEGEVLVSPMTKNQNVQDLDASTAQEDDMH
ncbi:MAG: FtsB family cell division protein [Bacillota bacterium]|jgi:cell division protein FtsB